MRIIRGFITLLITIWAAATLSFFVLRIIPGDAITAQLVQAGASAEDIHLERARLGLDDPNFVQYLRFMSRLLRGDLGNSLMTGLPVQLMIVQRLQPTISLASGALTLAVVIGIGLGMVAGLYDGYIGAPARFLLNLSISTPVYWTATLVIVLFSVELRWFPSSGEGTITHLILPVGVLGFHASGAIGRITQVNIHEVREMVFVRTARSKGLPEWHILTHHTLRVALIPVVGLIALQAGFLFSGTVITESIFARPGIGRLLLTATQNQDYPVVQGIVILVVIIYATFNWLADVLYVLLDPRLSS